MLFITISLLCFVLSNITGELLIRKCCPERQQLDATMTSCVDVPDRESNGFGTRRILASELRTEERPDFPWWMNNTVKTLSVDTLTEISSFLEDRDENQFIELGVQQPCEDHLTTVINTANKKVQLLYNGSLIYYNITFPPHSYCTDVAQGSNRTYYVYLLCSCLITPCVRKCCGSRSMLSIKEDRYSHSMDCIKNNGSSWQPTFYNRMEDGNLTKMEVIKPYLLFYRQMQCGSDRAIVLNDNSDWWIYPNGSVLVKGFGNGIPFGPEHYCGDLVAEADRAPRILICAQTLKYKPPEGRHIVYLVMFIIGAICLLLTLIVLALLPSRYRDLLAKASMCHCGSLVVTYVVLGATTLTPVVPHSMCISIPFIIQFSFLAAFFWLNVMCIDISWAFSGFRPPQGSVSERDRKKFIYYSLYAWGSPTIILIVTAVMEFVESIPDTYLKPNFGVKACWFKEKSASFAYFYGPMAALLLVNFILFIYTTVKIIQVQRDTRILHNGESGRHDGSNFKKDKKRLILYAKLFCLMGLTWITEIISVLYQDSPHYYWYVTDAINLLRAVFIFIIFCCKRKVFRLLKQRLFPSFGAENNASQSNGTRKSSSSTQNSILPPIPMNQLNRNGKVADKTTPENR
ncbi:probable G-protein coupled receptor Mth-like 3 isoform X2 [Anabrus simplex]|uniref:probable G-protein coupled receptor Mth-like 3 isoform X2 n=1 Tax=Anabrus simplex TaxID=316456 RepID=UPI0035A2F82F